MKKHASILCSCILIIAFSITCLPVANATHDSSSSVENSTDFGDTLTYSQDEYLAMINSSTTEDSLVSSQALQSTDSTQSLVLADYDETSQVEKTCSVFLALGRASVRNTAYDCMALVNEENQSDDTIQYRVSEYEYLNAIDTALNYEISSDDLSLSDFDVIISGNTATASVVESYTYYVDDGFDGESFRCREYYFTLENSDSGWKITNVTTNDPWETANDFEYAPIDVESAVNNQLDAIQSADTLVTPNVPTLSKSAALQGATTLLSSTTLNRWTYDTSVAVQYAAGYYNASSSSGYNSLFGYASENCQNFASQCVWAGLIGNYSSATSKTSIPAVSTSLVGSSAQNVWCRGQSTSYYSNYVLNWAWDNVCGFAKLISTSSSTRQGPYGGVHYGTLAYVAAGDVISWDTGGSPSATTLDHAMFVTQTTGTMGSRTKSNVKIAANNSSTNSAYQSLTSYAPSSYTDSYFADSIILSAYYSTAQP